MQFFDTMSIQFDLMACSETWIAAQIDPGCFDIQGYNMLIDNRLSSTGGGVALYLKSSFDYFLRNDLKMDCIENIWVKTDDLLIGVIYNPPVRREFLEQFEQVLHAIFLFKQKCPILGDINTHCIYALVRRTMAKEYVNLIYF